MTRYNSIRFAKQNSVRPRCTSKQKKRKQKKENFQLYFYKYEKKRIKPKRKQRNKKKLEPFNADFSFLFLEFFVSFFVFVFFFKWRVDPQRRIVPSSSSSFSFLFLSSSFFYSFVSSSFPSTSTRNGHPFWFSRVASFIRHWPTAPSATSVSRSVFFFFFFLFFISNFLFFFRPIFSLRFSGFLFKKKGVQHTNTRYKSVSTR